MQPSWIKEAVAYAPEPTAAAKAAVTPDRSAELADQLAAHAAARSRRSGRPWTALKRRPATAPPGTEGGAGRAGPGQGARRDALRESRAEGGG